MPMSVTPESIIRRRLDVRGQVQGVGFRPFVYRLARRCQLGGCVANNSNGALIEIEGPRAAVDGFERSLRDELPPLARISGLLRSEMKPRGEDTFHIDHSQHDAARRPEVTPDAAVCRDCLRELLDAGDRRYRYPFINCTNCGPRYSIIRSVPYDRPKTTMAVFEMCPDCASEYGDPADRRYHAQPNACPACGPQLELRRVDAATHGLQSGPSHKNRVAPASSRCMSGGETASGPAVGAGDADPIRAAARLLHEGGIVAIKGIGGYHLACRADLPETVQHLRARKLRDGKPLAVMVPDLDAARRICHLSATDEEALSSPAAPIVLATQCQNHGLALE
ncbi:MAG: Sua5/YciO/YrdC/YwlC family protein, partial [Planctomycetes bacterium]|nr:Sua5/YciO/YrdC/YwlC family protein [Planctomycetota bacterium]